MLNKVGIPEGNSMIRYFKKIEKNFIYSSFLRMEYITKGTLIF